VDEVAGTLGEGADAARRRAGALASSFALRDGPAAAVARTSGTSGTSDTGTGGRHRADD
jgi:hypothetical protein